MEGTEEKSDVSTRLERRAIVGLFANGSLRIP